jgi:hypothetical protein
MPTVVRDWWAFCISGHPRRQGLTVRAAATTSPLPRARRRVVRQRIEVAMTTEATVRPIVRVTDETTRAELVECLGLLNAEAMRISRRGKVGLLSEAHRVQHQRINAVLGDLLLLPE